MAYANKFNGNIVSTNSGFAGYAKQLYNGNIGSMVTAIGQFINSSNNAGLVSAYNYDQLNRIAEAKYFTEGSNGIVNATDNWNNKFTYDANGNILKQFRNGNNAMLAMDDMTDLS